MPKNSDTFLKSGADKQPVASMNIRGSIFAATLLIALIAIPATSAQVVFSQYDTTATISQDVIQIERTVTIKNNGQVPIIPGELHFRFFEQDGADRRAIEVSNVQAQSSRGVELTTKSVSRGDEQDVSVQVWDPLLPGFDYTFTMQYDIAFEASGILFHEISLPQEQTTIPIVEETTTFELDDRYHVTYAPETEVNKLSGNTVVQWGAQAEERTVEYSRLPFPRTGLRAVNVFWIAIILALLGVFMISFLRQRKQPRRKQPQQQYQQPPQYQQQYQQPQQQRYSGGQG